MTESANKDVCKKIEKSNLVYIYLLHFSIFQQQNRKKNMKNKFIGILNAFQAISKWLNFEWFSCWSMDHEME